MKEPNFGDARDRMDVAGEVGIVGRFTFLPTDINQRPREQQQHQPKGNSHPKMGPGRRDARRCRSHDWSGWGFAHSSKALAMASGCGSMRGETKCSPHVFLNNFRRSDVRLARVVSHFAQCPTLTQQVPVLIQLDLNSRQPFAVGRVQRSSFKEAVLFGDEVLNVL